MSGVTHCPELPGRLAGRNYLTLTEIIFTVLTVSTCKPEMLTRVLTAFLPFLVSEAYYVVSLQNNSPANTTKQLKTNEFVDAMTVYKTRSLSLLFPL